MLISGLADTNEAGGLKPADGQISIKQGCIAMANRTTLENAGEIIKNLTSFEKAILLTALRYLEQVPCHLQKKYQANQSDRRRQ